MFLKCWNLDNLKEFPRKHVKRGETTTLLQTFCLQYYKNYCQLIFSCCKMIELWNLSISIEAWERLLSQKHNMYVWQGGLIWLEYLLVLWEKSILKISKIPWKDLWLEFQKFREQRFYNKVQTGNSIQPSNTKSTLISLTI